MTFLIDFFESIHISRINLFLTFLVLSFYKNCLLGLGTEKQLSYCSTLVGNFLGLFPPTCHFQIIFLIVFFTIYMDPRTTKTIISRKIVGSFNDLNQISADIYRHHDLVLFCKFIAKRRVIHKEAKSSKSWGTKLDH